ncbi:AAA family ATPase, partial [Micromonospora sp. S4605]
MSSDPLIASLSAALDARPDDLPLRLHLAALLLDAGRAGEAIAQIGQALARDPGNGEAQALMQRALGGPV